MLSRWCSIVLWSAALLAQTREGSCILDYAKNGEVVKIRGQVFPTGHDVFIRLANCQESSENRVILVWDDDLSLGSRKIEVRKDAAFSVSVRARPS
jgi:hypothetical protein